MDTGLNAIVNRNMAKLADIASDAMAPLLQQYVMQSPPPNMDILVQLMAKKLEKDLTQQVQGSADIQDPMDSEISRLQKMKQHGDLRAQLAEQQQAAVAGQAQPAEQPAEQPQTDDQKGDGSAATNTAGSQGAANAEQLTSLFGGPAGPGKSAPGQGGGQFGAAMPSPSQAPIR